MRARRSALHTLVGAYVMDAVADREREEFERHLVTCDQCREDVRGLREAVAHLAAAAAVPPRRELREQTVRAAEHIRQLPPVVTGDAQRHRVIGRRHVGGAQGIGWRRGIAGRSWRRGIAGRSWLPTIAAGVAAVLAVTAIVLGVHLVSMQSRISAMEQRDSAIAAVLGSHDATTLTAQVRTGGTATVVMSPHARALVFTASGLTRLPGTKAYELWLMGPAGATPVGMLPAGHHGMSGPVVVSRLAPGDQLGLTIEPSTGSGHPTSGPVVLVALGP
jgi:anti-sigma factor RsiW